MSFLLDTDKQSDDYGDYYSMSRVYIPTVSFNDSHSVITVSVPDEVNLNVSYDEYDSHELSVVDGDESQYVIGSVLVTENGEKIVTTPMTLSLVILLSLSMMMMMSLLRMLLEQKRCHLSSICHWMSLMSLMWVSLRR
jgi:hypothetical protein